MRCKELLVIIALANFFLTCPWFSQDPIFKKNTRSSQDDTTSLVKLDRVTHGNPEKAQPYTNQLKSRITRTEYILSGQMLKLTLCSIVSKVVADENEDRVSVELQPLKLFRHSIIQSIYDNGMGNYNSYDGSRVIFQQSLFLARIVTWGGGFDRKEVCLNVDKMLMFSYKLKMGFGVDSYADRLDSLVSDMRKFVSSFDMVVFNVSFIDYRGALKDKKEQDTYFQGWVNSMQEKFQDFSFYRVEKIYNFDK